MPPCIRHFLVTLYEDAAHPLDRAVFLEELVPYTPADPPAEGQGAPEPVALQHFPSAGALLAGADSAGGPPAPDADPYYPVRSTYVAGRALVAGDDPSHAKICVFPTLRGLIRHLGGRGHAPGAIAALLGLPLPTVLAALAPPSRPVRGD